MDDLSGGSAGLKVVASGNSAEQLCVYDLRMSEQSPNSPLCSRECTSKHVYMGRGGRTRDVKTIRHHNDIIHLESPSPVSVREGAYAVQRPVSSVRLQSVEYTTSCTEWSEDIHHTNCAVLISLQRH